MLAGPGMVPAQAFSKDAFFDTWTTDNRGAELKTFRVYENDDRVYIEIGGRKFQAQIVSNMLYVPGAALGFTYQPSTDTLSLGLLVYKRD